MRFKIKRPCEHCPFRNDRHPFLRADRAKEIAEQLLDDNTWFACHETTPAGTGRRIKRADQSHCAGALVVLWRSGRINVAGRLALTMRLFSKHHLTAKVPVFNSLDEFVAHHIDGGKKCQTIKKS